MLIKYKHRKDIPSEDDVALPVYSMNDVSDNCRSYHRLYESAGYLFADEIVIRNDIDFEITTRRFQGNDLGINGDYYLGKNEFASTKEEWEKALTQVHAFVGDIVRRSAR